MQKRYLTVFLVCTVAFVSCVTYAQTDMVTWFYRTDLAPLYGRETVDLCDYAQSSGLTLQCVATGADNPVDAVNHALQSGSVIIPAHIALATEDFKSHLVNLGQLIHEDDQSNAYKPLISESSYGLLSLAQIPALFYNRDLVAKLSGPSAHTYNSWSLFVSALISWFTKVDPVTKKAVNQYGFGLSWEDILAAWVASTDEVDTTPFWPYEFGFRQKITSLRKLQQSGIKLTDINLSDAWQAFLDGELPVAFGYLTQAGTIPESIDWAVTPLPGDCNYSHLDLAEYWALLDPTHQGKGWQVYRWLFLGEGVARLAQRNPFAINLLNMLPPVIPIDLEVRGVPQVLDAGRREMQVDTRDIWQSPEVVSAVQEYLAGGGSLDNISLQADQTFRAEVGIPQLEFIASNEDLMRLPFTGQPSGGLKWAPSGTLLAYGSEKDLQVIDVMDQTKRFTIPQKPEAIVWSPDGKQIAFVTAKLVDNTDLTADDIKVLNLGTGHITLVSRSRFNDNEPAWSYESNLLAFTSVIEQGDTDIWVKDVQSDAYRNITLSPTFDLQPVWVPGGGNLLFLSDREGNGKTLHMMNSDGTNIRALTEQGVPNAQYAVSPDGSQVAYLAQLDRNAETLSIINLKNDHQMLVLDEQFDVVHFTWSPDGSKLAITIKAGVYCQLMVVDLATEQIKPFFIRGQNGLCSWSPDGRYIAFSGYYNTQTALLVVPVEGSDPVMVFGLGKLVVSPTWSADGSMLSFANLDKSYRTEGIYTVHVSLP